ncbi:MAG: hypothetical protein AAF627_03430 [Myxococcota bacterium]
MLLAVVGVAASACGDDLDARVFRFEQDLSDATQPPGVVEIEGRTFNEGRRVCTEQQERFRRFQPLRLYLIDETVGVHPSESVIADDCNPFQEDSFPLAEPDLFELDGVGNVASFYGWATALTGRVATQPGLAQLFAADALVRIAANQPLQAPDADPATLRFMAAEGYRNVLVFFPKDQLFAEDPTAPGLSLATLAAERLQGLQGLLPPSQLRLPPGWVFVDGEAVFQLDRFRGDD